MKKGMTYIDLFSGSGGFSLGFENKGVRGDRNVLDITLRREGDYERTHSRDLSRYASQYVDSYLSSGMEN